VVVAAAPQPAATTPGAADMKAALLAVVSEKTGYPQEMLDLNMDMEADLGIDSIKRVEILGALQTQFPEMPKPEPEVLAELRTLGQVAEFVQQGTASAPAPAAAVALPVQAEPAPAQPAAAPAAPAAPAGVTNAEVSQNLLKVVSEKTGYPQEMLDLNMDMEADLGIDSIKRVEILGAVQQDYPNLPKPEPEQLAELRTLQQVIDFLVQGSPAMPAAEVQRPFA
jgi:acyl carrier protein